MPADETFGDEQGEGVLIDPRYRVPRHEQDLPQCISRGTWDDRKRQPDAVKQDVSEVADIENAFVVVECVQRGQGSPAVSVMSIDIELDEQ
jgi:hypothetical protein